MPSRLSYADAVAILGGPEPFGADAGLLDVKAAVVRQGARVAGQILDSVRRLGRHQRSAHLQAAHVVLVVAALFEELDGRDGSIADAVRAGDGTLGERLLPVPVPLPGPDLPYESELRSWFLAAAAHLDRDVPDLDRRAVARFDGVQRRLAADVPEFALWAARLGPPATARGLERLEDLLLLATSGRDPGRHRDALARAYRADLERPVLGGDAGEVLLPALGAAYLDPRYRVRAAGPGARPADEQWWSEAAVRGDFADFLAAHLTTTQATEAPMLLLGQPGAGKSSLTRILAARLPAGDFFACRVPLREVPAEADVRDQVELALRREIGETVSWAELSRDAAGALPVILLDGFDELLQATGLHQSDYLQQVAAFQRREAALGRPVAVLVTTRVAVADRARLPAGALAVRLEPFDDDQVGRWLTVWNRTNARLKPLTADVVLRFRALAEQPLLLLMLALYDATDGALQDGAATLDDGQLYERLLTSFAEREVRRLHAGQPDAAVAGLVQQELLRLSVVAFAMFHRLRLWVTERELDDDLAGLGITPSRPGLTEGFRSPLTAGQEMVGRFFFIQRAQAFQDDQTLVTYEFLHATFGEYLVARLVVQAVRDTEAREAASTLALRLGAANDDDLLRSLLGFTPLTARATVLPFVAGLLDGPDRDRLRAWLTGRTAEAVTRPQYSASRYRPIDKRVDHWMATYSYNLMILTLACGGPLRASDLFDRTTTPAAWLRNSALQWQAAVPGGMWMDVMEVLEVTRDWHNGRRDIVLELAPEWTRDNPGPPDVYWMNGLDAVQSDMPFTAGVELRPALRSMLLANHLSDDVMVHALGPLIEGMPETLTQFIAPEEGSHTSVAHALVRMWLAASQNHREKDLVAIYSDASWAAVLTGSTQVADLVLGSMRADAYRLPPRDVCVIVNELLDNRIITSSGAASAVHCLTESGAADDAYGAALVSRLTET
ncbi:NACHT domain-containing protein [Actinoplanes sp. NPDC000266]